MATIRLLICDDDRDFAESLQDLCEAHDIDVTLASSGEEAIACFRKDSYDAALMDRASSFTILRRVTLPLLKPITLFLLIIGIINSFQLFTQIWVMTAGGPRDATTTLAYQIVVKAFKYREFGLASAEALMLGGIIFVVAVMQYRFFSREIEY